MKNYELEKKLKEFVSKPLFNEKVILNKDPNYPKNKQLFSSNEILSKIICLNKKYSTTRMLTKEKPKDLKELPFNSKRKEEGGLRKKGFYKKSYQNDPLISIVTVVKNGKECLEEAIKSVIDQKYSNIEYIILDNASIDGTLDIMKKYNDSIDYWISEPDRGIYDAMNKGIRIAGGDWIFFLGADDILLNCLHNIVSYFKNQNEIYYGDVYMPGKHKIYDGEFNSYKLARTNICHQSVFYSKKVFNKLSYSTKYPLLADWELNMKCNKDKNFKFIYIPILISIYNDIEGSSSNKKDILFVQNYLDLIKLYFPNKVFLLVYFRKVASKFLKAIGVKK